MPQEKKAFTIGYGGRSPQQLLDCLIAHGVRTVADIRISPRGHLGSFTRARSNEKGIEALLAQGGIAYVWIEALGNRFRDQADWRPLYAADLDAHWEAARSALAALHEPFCLLCAERRETECHRSLVAERLAREGYAIEHL